MLKINSLRNDFFNMKYWVITRNGLAKYIDAIFRNMKIKYDSWNAPQTIRLRNNQNSLQQRERGLATPLDSGGTASIHDGLRHDSSTSKNEEKAAKFPHFVNLSRTPKALDAQQMA